VKPQAHAPGTDDLCGEFHYIAVQDEIQHQQCMLVEEVEPRLRIQWTTKRPSLYLSNHHNRSEICL